MNIAIVEAVMARLPHAVRDAPLAPFTTYRLGGPAAVLIRAHTIEDLFEVRDVLAHMREGTASTTDGVVMPDEVLVIGQGSNLLVGEDGFAGLVVVLDAEFDTIEMVTATELRAGAAVKLPVLARRSASWGRGGLEWMVGVPGSVGGAVRMNAGGHGSDVAANLIDVEIVDLLGAGARSDAVRCVPAAQLRLAYRRSDVSSTQVVVAARFSTTDASVSVLEENIVEIVRWRRSNQPGGANCGSVFTNPTGDSAGRLIDAAGCKGLRIGSASVSEKHANFIQSDEHGRASDVWAAVGAVRRRVFDAFGIVLIPEVRTVGFDATLEQLQHEQLQHEQPQPEQQPEQQQQQPGDRHDQSTDGHPPKTGTNELGETA